MLDKSEPRFLRIIASAGYGNSTLAKQNAGRFERAATRDRGGVEDAFELAKQLAHTLSSTAPSADARMLEELALDEDAGAWRLMELLARVCLAAIDLYRRTAVVDHNADRPVAAFTLRLTEASLYDSHGARVSLTNRELELLAFLAIGKRTFSNDEIVDAIWPDNPERGAASLKVVVARIRQKTVDPTIIRSSPGGYTAGVQMVDLEELDEFFKTIRRGTLAADWTEGGVETLVAWLRRLRDGFPAIVAKWPWFVATDARYQRELYDVALLCASKSLDAGRFDVALRVAEELVAADPGDELAEKIADRARAGLRSPASFAS